MSSSVPNNNTENSSALPMLDGDFAHMGDHLSIACRRNERTLSPTEVAAIRPDLASSQTWKIFFSDGLGENNQADQTNAPKNGAEKGAKKGVKKATKKTAGKHK